MSVVDFLIGLDIALLIISMILVVLLNSNYVKTRMNRRQKFVLDIGTNIAILLMSIDTYVLMIHYIKMSPYSWDAITITIAIFGMIIVTVLEIIIYRRRNNKSRK